VNVLLILTIINAALQGLASIKGNVGVDASIAQAFIVIIQNGMAAYQQAAGKPLDLSLIPIEQPVK
jgi:hypothetical protein